MIYLFPFMLKNILIGKVKHISNLYPGFCSCSYSGRDYECITVQNFNRNSSHKRPKTKLFSTHNCLTLFILLCTFLIKFSKIIVQSLQSMIHAFSAKIMNFSAYCKEKFAKYNSCIFDL